METAPSIREWARQNGWPALAERGKLPRAVHAAYQAAHPGVQAEPTRNGTTCKDCGRTWTALKECHCSLCHRQFASVRWFDAHMRGPDGKHGRPWCVDPLTIPTSAKNSAPKLMLKAGPWGDVVASTAERPDSFDADEEPVLL